MISFRFGMNSFRSGIDSFRSGMNSFRNRFFHSDLSSGQDTLEVDATKVATSHNIFNYTPPTKTLGYDIHLNRKVIPADVMKQKLSLMPGFRVTWRYSGMEVEPEAEYYNPDYPISMAFVRNSSNNILQLKSTKLALGSDKKLQNT